MITCYANIAGINERGHQPTRTTHDVKKAREESMERRDILRRGKHIQQKLANMPPQKTYRLDKRCNGATYPGLPIRSLTEKCTAAEQHRRWINDSPTRSTETLSDYNRWITHFKTAEQHPIHLTTLSPEGQAKTKWWHTFLVEVKAINPAYGAEQTERSHHNYSTPHRSR